MIYKTVKTGERALQIVKDYARENNLLVGSYIDTIEVRCESGHTLAIKLWNIKKGTTLTCAFNELEGNDDLTENEVLVIK